MLHIPTVPIAATLWISADAQWSAQHTPSPLLTRLHPDAGWLSGDVVCEPSHLPFERDSVQAIVVQHAADAMADFKPLLAELCRVLEPGGQLFWFGLNPLSVWAAWSHWHEGPTPSLHPRWLREVDRLLMRHGVDAVDSRYLGGLWPRSQIANEARRFSIIDGLRGAWLLAARKRRAVLTPLRPAVRASRLRQRALTAIPSSRIRQ
ncbi:MAG: methyltransferase domain-containing protein [Dokdonella sp.]